MFRKQSYSWQESGKETKKERKQSDDRVAWEKIYI